jgi:hypothetical protein
MAEVTQRSLMIRNPGTPPPTRKFKAVKVAARGGYKAPSGGGGLRALAMGHYGKR